MAKVGLIVGLVGETISKKIKDIINIPEVNIGILKVNDKKDFGEFIKIP
ncbi:MAG: hypothetical protein P8Y23_07095 [Candidatus Lokiarchaeota archaeon]|jgi:hypothetical protein